MPARKLNRKLFWYTSLAGGSYKEIIRVFECKYPGIKVEAYRASGSELVVRMEEEYKAGRHLADALETTEGNLMFLRDGGLQHPYNSPVLNLSGRCQRGCWQGTLLLGAREGILHRLHLQQKSSLQNGGAEKL